MIELAFLLQQGSGVDPVGVFRFFAGFSLVMLFFTGALSFTYWISKDE